jgi:glycosyltransferase involved in cell wall biosynthesis
MKIGVYDPYLDDIGGGEKYMLSAAECLSENNEVTLFWDNRQDLELAKERFGLNLKNIKVSKNIFSPSFKFAKRLWETRKYDAIIVLSDGSIPLSLSKRLYLHIQRPIKDAAGGVKNRLKLARVNQIFCNSYFTKSYIDKQTGTESIVIYPPVDLRPKKAEKENIILHVGRFRVVDETVGGAKDYKKQYVMVDVFKKISKKLPRWKFVLAVSVNKDDKEEFETLIQSTKNYSIEFLINKTNDELWDIYSRAKIYWHASGFGEDLEKHPEFAEHFGISTVEAMGGGAVPIVFNAGGQKEIVEDNASGFLWNTRKDLENKTLYLTKEDKILEGMSKEAIKRAKDFAGKRFCDEIKRMVERV